MVWITILILLGITLFLVALDSDSERDFNRLRDEDDSDY